jgi:hypothetical protein
MRLPIDKTPLSSREDRIQANIAIKNVKNEIEETEVELAEAQLEVDTARKEPAEREAWMSPVRMISYDELTIISNLCAEYSWTAPIRLAAVCQTWRDAILANSRVWSCIHLNSDRALKLVPLYLERSGQRMLRVRLDNGSASPEYYIPITQIADRIRCLSIPTFSTLLYGITFPFLNRLHLIAEINPMIISRLSRSRFPALCRLDVYFPERAYRYLIDKTVDSPLPHTLIISSCPGVNVTRIVHRYSQSLTSLDLTIPRGVSFSRRYIVPLPQLESLTFNDFGTVRSPLTMITPILKVFVTDTNYDSASFPLEMDLSLLTHVRTEGSQIPPLLELSGLKFLQLYPDSDYYSRILRPLVDDPSVCRELESIEVRLTERDLSDEDYSDFQKLILQINGSRSSHIEHFVHSRFARWHEELPQVGYYIVSNFLDLPLLIAHVWLV